jgi:DNA-binding Xre family transcriptional regulator
MARWALREIAEHQGWNPHSLAREAKLSYNTVRPIWYGEAKRIDLITLSRLAGVLGVAPGALVVEGEAETAQKHEETDQGNSQPVQVAA